MHQSSNTNRSRALLFSTALLASAVSASASAEHGPSPVLMVIANQDFYYQEYGDTRQSLEAAGLEVIVAAATTETAVPQDRGTWAHVDPDIALSDVNADDYSAIVFVGGWGSSSYQYDFPGTYEEPLYRPDKFTTRSANRVLGEFHLSGRPIGGIGHGVTVLAWARVDGGSVLDGRTVVGPASGVPAFRLRGTRYPNAEVPARALIEWNGASMLTSQSVGEPMTATDDVWVDGKIITAENYDSAARFGETLAAMLR